MSIGMLLKLVVAVRRALRVRDDERFRVRPRKLGCGSIVSSDDDAASLGRITCRSQPPPIEEARVRASPLILAHWKRPGGKRTDPAVFVPPPVRPEPASDDEPPAMSASGSGVPVTIKPPSDDDSAAEPGSVLTTPLSGCHK